MTDRPITDDLCCEDEVVHSERVILARQHLLEAGTNVRLAELFKMLGDPTRLRIISALASTELCVYDIAAVVGLSQSAISHQLRLLRALGLVRARKAGKHVFYTLDDQHIEELFRSGLAHIEHLP
jgi:DNA-binding transcriptional ArsR family regulator